ncbi:MAG: hypothetical protein M0Q92_08045 [Methanoregula sp.]|jgi:hypothetical protein|nr:hypothetical protein [Methanoregula sp.]
MSSVADINGIWIADTSIPVENCGIRDPESKWKNTILKKFSPAYNHDFKHIGSVTGNGQGRRIWLKSTIHRKAEAMSLSDPGVADRIDITAANTGVLQYGFWQWPKAGNWRIPGEYEVKVTLGYIRRPDMQAVPAWGAPIGFKSEVVNS